MNDALYLDHAATSPPLPEALDAFTHANREAYANPSSIHRAGAAARIFDIIDDQHLIQT